MCNDLFMFFKFNISFLTSLLAYLQSGRFGKLNKRVSFPETLDLSPYMSEAGDDGDIYKLYAVVVHVDMLNASYFGHYICYTKDFSGNWYRIDDCKVLTNFLYIFFSQVIMKFILHPLVLVYVDNNTPVIIGFFDLRYAFLSLDVLGKPQYPVNSI